MSDLRFESAAEGESAVPRRWAFLTVLTLAILAEGIFAVFAHRSDEELTATARSGSPRDRVYALYVLSRRNTPRAYDASDVRALLMSKDPLVREWAMTSHVRALSDGTGMQRARLARIRDPSEAARSRFLLEHQVRGNWMTLGQLRSFVEARDSGSRLRQGGARDR